MTNTKSVEWQPIIFLVSMPKYDAKKHLGNHAANGKIAHTTSDKYTRCYNTLWAALRTKCYEVEHLKEWLDAKKCTPNRKVVYICSVLKLLRVKKPDCPHIQALELLIKEYNESEEMIEYQRTLDDRHFNEQENHRDTTNPELLRTAAERSSKIREFYDNWHETKPGNIRAPDCEHASLRVVKFNRNLYKVCEIWALMFACNPPTRTSDFPRIMIKDRIPEGTKKVEAWYHEGVIVFEERVKDRAKNKPNPPFNVHEIREKVDEYIASLPPDQIYLFVDTSGKPMGGNMFGQTIKRWSTHVHIPMNVSFLRRKDVEDDVGFLEGCERAELRGHTLAMARDTYASRKRKEQISAMIEEKKIVN